MADGASKKDPHTRFSWNTLGHAIDDLSTEQPAVIYTVVLALIVLIGAIDYLTGYELNFFVFYFIPIAIAAWYINRRAALAFAFAAGLTWFTVVFFQVICIRGGSTNIGTAQYAACRL